MKTRRICIGFFMRTHFFDLVRLFCCCTSLNCISRIENIFIFIWYNISLRWTSYTRQRITIIIICNFSVMNGGEMLGFGIIANFLDLLSTLIFLIIFLFIDLKLDLLLLLDLFLVSYIDISQITCCLSIYLFVNLFFKQQRRITRMLILYVQIIVICTWYQHNIFFPTTMLE